MGQGAMHNLRRTARDPLAPAPGRRIARVDLRAYRDACRIVTEAAHQIGAERDALHAAVALFVMSPADRRVALAELRGDPELPADRLVLVGEQLARLDAASRSWPDGWPRPRRPAPTPPLEPVTA